MGFHSNFHNIADKEFARRISIGFNDWLSLEERRVLIARNAPLQELSRTIKGFRSYEKEARGILKWLDDPLDSIISYGDEDFPSFEGLEKHLPYFLLCRGPVPRKDSTCIGIVGTRMPDYDGLQKAFELGLGAAVGGACVISGFAEGIDQASMRGCVAAKGACIGVLACGHDVEYPSLTSRLRESIVDCGGCIVSRFAPDTPSYKSNFVSRNMVIAAYSNALVVVQAPEKSGTLITSDYALSMGKDVFVGSAGVETKDSKPDSRRAGSQALANDGALVISSMVQWDGFSHGNLVRRLEGTAASLSLNAKSFENGEAFRFGDQVYIVERNC